MKTQDIRSRWLRLTLSLLVALGVMLAIATTASAHPRAPWVTALRVERALDATPAIQMSFCNGLGRPLRPALPINRRFKHFGCVIFDSRGGIWCAMIHTVRGGGLRAGRFWPNGHPQTPPRACGVN